MAKDTFYFSHDYGARNDPKLVKVFMKLKLEGIGLYWCLIEMLYEQDGYLQIDECESYAFALRTECVIIESLIRDFGLFTKNDKLFWSESVLRRLNKRDEKSKKASNSANLRWEYANAMRAQSEGNAIKESKGKEIKGKESKEENSLALESDIGGVNDLKEKKGASTEKVEERSKLFMADLAAFVPQYGKEMVRAFYEYWVEFNKSKTKMRWEMQHTWDLSKRLARWANNNKDFKGQNTDLTKKVVVE